MSAPKPYMNNRFAVLSAPDSADEENQNEAEFQEQEAGKPLKAASLDGLEDKPKAPICAAQMITIEDPVPVLNYVLVDPQVSLLPSRSRSHSRSHSRSRSLVRAWKLTISTQKTP